MKQNTLRLSLPRPVGVSARNWQLDEKHLNNPVRHTPPEKLLCDLLKRQGRRIMADITECPTDTLPAHLARLADWRETVEHHLRHDLNVNCHPHCSAIVDSERAELVEGLASVLRNSRHAEGYSQYVCWLCKETKTDRPAHISKTIAGDLKYCSKCWNAKPSNNCPKTMSVGNGPAGIMCKSTSSKEHLF